MAQVLFQHKNVFRCFIVRFTNLIIENVFDKIVDPGSVLDPNTKNLIQYHAFFLI